MSNQPTILTLSSGLTVIFSQPTTQIVSAYLEMTIRAGGRDDDSIDFGLAHFVEHVVAHIIESKLRHHGWIGSYLLDTFNAGTDHEKTTYYVACDTIDIPEVFNLFGAIVNPMTLGEEITVEIVEQEKAAAREELLGYLDEEMTAPELHFMKEHYGMSALGRGTALGSKESIGTFTSEKVKNHLQQYYRPENSFLVISGNFDTSKIPVLDKTAANPVTNQISVSQDTQPLQPNAHKITYFPLQGTQQNQVILARKIRIANITQAIALLVLTDMLKMYLEFFAREQQLAYNVTASYSAYRDHMNVVVQCSTEATKTLRISRWAFVALREFKRQLTPYTYAMYRENFVKTKRMDLPYPKETLDNMAWYFYHFAQPLTTEQELEQFEKVQLADLLKLFEDVFEGATSTLQVSGRITADLKRGIEKIYPKSNSAPTMAP